MRSSFIARMARGAVVLPPVTDNFNRANNASSLGTATTGELWTTHQGVAGISSNQAYFPTSSGGSPGLASVASGRSDATVTLTIAVASASNGGMLLRYVDVSNYIFLIGTTANTFIVTRVAGVSTIVATAGVAVANNDVLTAVLAGTSITAKKNGTTIASVTESNHLTALRHGIYSQSSTNRFDDFSIVS